MAEITFERDALYEAVWRTPMTKLAAAYGLSDNGLKNVCAKLDVPVPPRGYWARLAAGQKVVAIPLPPAKSSTAEAAVVWRAGAGRPTLPPDEEEQAWLREKQAEEAGLPPAPLEAATKPHEAIEQFRGMCAAAMRKRERRLAEYAKARAKLRPGHADFTAFMFSDVVRGGVDLGYFGAPCRVSSEGVSTVAAILGVISLEAERRQFKVLPRLKDGRLALKWEKGELSVRCAEQLGASPDSEFVVTIGGVGVTELKLGPWPAPKLQEYCRSELFVRIYRRFVNARAQARETEKRRAEEHASHERRMEEIAREQEERRRIEEERARQAAALLEANKWGQAETLREYARHIASLGGPAAATWCEWALKAADAQDPTSERLRVSGTDQRSST